MTKQPDLFDICWRRHGGNPESLEANLATDKDRDRRRIFEFLTIVGNRGRTCDELEVALNLRHQTCSARCSELLRAGLVKRSGEKRRTRAGCKAAVLIRARLPQ